MGRARSGPALEIMISLDFSPDGSRLQERTLVRWDGGKGNIRCEASGERNAVKRRVGYQSLSNSVSRDFPLLCLSTTYIAVYSPGMSLSQKKKKKEIPIILVNKVIGIIVVFKSQNENI